MPPDCLGAKPGVTPYQLEDIRGHLASLCLTFLMCEMRVIIIICKNGGWDNNVLRST